MKLKRIGAVLAGAALVGATVAGAVAAADDTNVPDRDFFIDPADGMNNSLIVVGSDAAAADVVSAAYVSSKIGQMAYYEEVTEDFETVDVAYDEEIEVDNWLDDSNGDEYFDDYRYYLDDGDWTPADQVPDSWVVLPYVCAEADDATLNEPFPVEAIGTEFEKDVYEPWWDYDVYFDAWSQMDTGDNFLMDTGCAYEAITVDFSVRDVECTQDMCIGCMAGCDQMGLFNVLEETSNNGDPAYEVVGTYTFDELIEMDDLDWEMVVGTYQLEECQTYPNVYAPNYWGSPSGADDICDPVGGIQYRTIVDGWETPDDSAITWTGIVGPASEAYGVCDENAPQDVDLYCEPCDVYFLGKHYDSLSFGTDEDGYDYMFYGTPEWYVEEKVKVGETSQEYGEGWTVTVNDLGIYENKAHLTITNPDGESFDYLTVIDTYTSQVPSVGEGDSDVTGDYNDNGANEENDTLIFKEDTFNIYSLCGAEEEGSLEIDGEAVFAVDFTKTMIGAAGTYVIEYDAYALKDYGVLREQIYPGDCDPGIDPAIKVGDLEWYLNIIPNNGVQDVDLDNDAALWETGNPNYNAGDNLTIYAPIEGVEADFWMFDEDAGDFTLLPAFVPMYTVEEDDGSNTADLIPKCSPMLELWLATPVELAGLCDEELSITLNDCEGSEYFTLNVTDEIHTDYRIDGDIELSRTTKVGETVTTHYVDLEPEALVKLDENIDTAMKQEYNLVLIGGPVANTIVQELVDLEKTTFEKWDTSEGELELIEDAFADGKHVLIVAGKDRDATTTAALDLVNAL